jgi:amidophosphoribosyltransferase
MQGLVGIFSKDDAARKALYLLYGVQHRGQESSGISAAGDRSLRSWKGRGLVSHVFDEKFRSFTHPDDYVYVGCTSGENSNEFNFPPLTYKWNHYEFSIVMDGYIPNQIKIFNEDIMGSFILEELEKRKDFFLSIVAVMKRLSNSYFSMVIALHDKKTENSELYAVRDRYGVRPMFMGYNENEIFITSESAPIDVLESMGQTIETNKDVFPGSIIKMGNEGFQEEKILDPKRAHCVFEWVYYGRPDSVIEGRTVHSVRKRLGHALVQSHNLRGLYGTNGENVKDIVVIPVPDSGRSVSIGVAEKLKITSDEGVIKNAYLGRTYIIDDPNFRRVASDLKHNTIKETVKGKKVIICDDSIVRGTVSESIAQNLIQAGAAEVQFLVSYGPIYYPCFSDPSDKLLAASAYKGKSLQDVGKLVASKLPSINNMRYNTPANVVRAIDLPENHLCTFCMTGLDPFN